MPSYQIKNKVFFITGGAQGFGMEIAHGVLAKGAKVFFVDILKEKGEETLQKLAQQFGSSKVAFSHIDVVNRKEFEDAFAEAARIFGQVDVLLSNAAILDEINIKRMIEINFLAVLHGSEIAVAHMRKDKGGKGGRIIAMSSIAGLYYYHGLRVYNAAKHGIRVYTKASSQNPKNEAMGIEYASFHSDATNVGIFPNIDEDKQGLEGFQEVLETYIGRLTPIEFVVDAFIELVSLETMNGADLFVAKDKKSYMEVEAREIGDKYPQGE